jgi:hypothetical protein
MAREEETAIILKWEKNQKDPTETESEENQKDPTERDAEENQKDPTEREDEEKLINDENRNPMSRMSDHQRYKNEIQLRGMRIVYG